MPNDFATLVYDFWNQPSDYDRAAGFPLREIGGFSFPRLIGGGFHQGGVGAAGAALVQIGNIAYKLLKYIKFS